MKSRIKNIDVFNCDDNREILISAKEIKKQFDAEFDKRTDELFEAAIRDIAPQLMATVLQELNTEFGWGKKRLRRLVDGVNGYFQLMQTGILGKKFNAIDLIERMKTEFDIDLEVKNENTH